MPLAAYSQSTEIAKALEASAIELYTLSKRILDNYYRQSSNQALIGDPSIIASSALSGWIPTGFTTHTSDQVYKAFSFGLQSITYPTNGAASDGKLLPLTRSGSKITTADSQTGYRRVVKNPNGSLTTFVHVQQVPGASPPVYVSDYAVLIITYQPATPGTYTVALKYRTQAEVTANKYVNIGTWVDEYVTDIISLGGVITPSLTTATYSNNIVTYGSSHAATFSTNSPRSVADMLFSMVASIVNDTGTALDKTWSSMKINGLLGDTTKYSQMGLATTPSNMTNAILAAYADLKAKDTTLTTSINTAQSNVNTYQATATAQANTQASNLATSNNNLNALINDAFTSGATNTYSINKIISLISIASTAAKNELINGASTDLDTFKEAQDKINLLNQQLAADSGQLSNAISILTKTLRADMVQSFTDAELTQMWSNLKLGTPGIDYLTLYNNAKDTGVATVL